MEKIKQNQIYSVLAILREHTKWDKVNFEGSALEKAITEDPKGAGERFTAFLQNGCQFVFDKPKPILTKPFEITEFLNAGYSIWRGPADGNGLSGKEDIDSRSLSLVEIDPVDFIFKTYSDEGEKMIDGKGRIFRSKIDAENINLGGNVFLGLWLDYQVNKKSSVLEFFYQSRGIASIAFPGLILLTPKGKRSILCLFRRLDGEWSWECSWIHLAFSKEVVLATSKFRPVANSKSK